MSGGPHAVQRATWRERGTEVRERGVHIQVAIDVRAAHTPGWFPTQRRQSKLNILTFFMAHFFVSVKSYFQNCLLKRFIIIYFYLDCSLLFSMI